MIRLSLLVINSSLSLVFNFRTICNCINPSSRWLNSSIDKISVKCDVLLSTSSFFKYLSLFPMSVVSTSIGSNADVVDEYRRC